MAPVVSLAEALADRRLFRGGRPLGRDQGATASGFAALDDALPWNGFPRGALTEILLPMPGLGEIELLSAAWARIGEKERLAFVAPPCIPYAPALLRAKWPLARFAWIEAPAAQAAWAAEQCLRAGCLGAVAFWLPGGDDKSLRRLQLAAEEGSAHAFLFRPARHAANASPAALRLMLEPAPGQLKVRVLKVRGAVPPAVALQRERSECGSMSSPRAGLATTARGGHVELAAAARGRRVELAPPVHGELVELAATVRGKPIEPEPRENGSTSSPQTDTATTIHGRLVELTAIVRGAPVEPEPRGNRINLAATVLGELVEPLPRGPGSTASPRTDLAG